MEAVTVVVAGTGDSGAEVLDFPSKNRQRLFIYVNVDVAYFFGHLVLLTLKLIALFSYAQRESAVTIAGPYDNRGPPFARDRNAKI
ncbi:hypothetical protein CG716_11655 [Mycolicibacterium sphagni]|uniref:Uncharacterized protein n=1 Tax=Mycolicibacterium sphagni TaxID=1786 RepID=A0A255DV44_9MYCO|nr:hypothetical protein CG716_11655 [Mycolicibacterium sphagni]